MKNSTTIIFALILAITVTSCKKASPVKPKDPKDETEQITTSELSGHYITMEVANGNPNLRVLYFSKEGNDIKATMDGYTFRRQAAVNVADNLFTFDFDSDGSKLYTFKLINDNTGSLTLESYSYKNKATADVSLTYAQIDKTDDAPNFTNKTMVQPNPLVYIKLLANSWMRSTTSNFSNSPETSIYTITPGAWKGNRDNADYMGVSVPKWKDNNYPLLLIENNISKYIGIYTGN